ncbi:CPBP family intramembrane glutamic endopeptidase [Romboutsia hominis]|uniref:CPBP family intramembrane glutamic endopeptidase n=1 Tax=Romboutsia hominis TaxID=1507512 RepID=UPI001F05B342|nr:CPBP family intramembrane glutamic endopeptidase [Romboutsia hominis]MCH1960483.1 CPBP family intramembrane metalloprotease [Romboutsia hominis]MCH1969085.1 CPBP family intramembrane metalloprotease [Romboutsia hominis]
MRRKSDIKIIDFILIQVISFLIVLTFNYKYIGILMNLSIYDDRNKVFIICTQVISIIILLLYLGISIDDIKKSYIDFKEKLDIKEIIGRYINSIMLSLGVTLLLISIAMLTYKPYENSLLTSSGDPIYTGNIIIVIVSVAIIGPILEEIIFRKVLFISISKKYNYKIGILISSILFGIGHSIDKSILASLFGGVLCILYIKYENILIPIFLHIINNSMSIVLKLPQESKINKNIDMTTSTIHMYLILGLVITTLSVYYYIRFINLNKKYIK